MLVQDKFVEKEVLRGAAAVRSAAYLNSLRLRCEDVRSFDPAATSLQGEMHS
jgi:hypothetical protein